MFMIHMEYCEDIIFDILRQKWQYLINSLQNDASRNFHFAIRTMNYNIN